MSISSPQLRQAEHAASEVGVTPVHHATPSAHLPHRSLQLHITRFFYAPRSLRSRCTDVCTYCAFHNSREREALATRGAEAQRPYGLSQSVLWQAGLELQSPQLVASLLPIRSVTSAHERWTQMRPARRRQLEGQRSGPVWLWRTPSHPTVL